MPLLVLELSEGYDSCRDARSVRPLCQVLQRHGFNGDGRTDRASLQIVTRCVRCVKGYGFMVLTGTDAIPLDTSRASLQGVVSSDRLRLSTMSVRSDLGVLVARHYLVPLPAVDVSPQARSPY